MRRSVIDLVIGQHFFTRPRTIDGPRRSWEHPATIPRSVRYRGAITIFLHLLREIRSRRHLRIVRRARRQLCHLIVLRRILYDL